MSGSFVWEQYSLSNLLPYAKSFIEHSEGEMKEKSDGGIQILERKNEYLKRM